MDCVRIEMGARIREAMDDAGLAPKQVASMTGLSYNTVVSCIRGDRTPSAASVVALCRCLNCSADWLLGLRGGAE